MNIDINPIDFINDESKKLVAKAINEGVTRKLKSKGFIDNLVESMMDDIIDDMHDSLDYHKIGKFMANQFEQSFTKVKK